jgi:putative protease
MEIYGYIPVMVTAGCLKKTENRCDLETGFDYRIKDRTNSYMTVLSVCRYCYNVIYNSVPLYLGGSLQSLFDMNINHLAIRFTMESEREADDILDRVENELAGCNTDYTAADFTRGHFRRGVL